jgi:hypothetical protein
MVVFCVVAMTAFIGTAGEGFAKKHHKKDVPAATVPVPGPVITVSSPAEITVPTAAPPRQLLAEATCPAGTELVGGGFDRGAPDQTFSDDPHIIVSRRTGLSTWMVTAYTGLDDPTHITAHAYCRANVAPLTEVLLNLVANPSVSGDLGGETTAIVLCPTGMQAIAGGFAGGIMAIFGQVTGSARTLGGAAWRLTIVNSANASAELTAIAYCTPDQVFTGPDVTAKAPVPTGAGGSFQNTSVTAPACPSIPLPLKKHRSKRHHGHKRLAASAKKKHKKKPQQRFLQTQVVGGGFGTGPGLYHFPNISLTDLYDTSLSPSGWTATVSQRGSIAGRLTARAYCMV